MAATKYTTLDPTADIQDGDRVTFTSVWSGLHEVTAIAQVSAEEGIRLAGWFLNDASSRLRVIKLERPVKLPTQARALLVPTEGSGALAFLHTRRGSWINEHGDIVPASLVLEHLAEGRVEVAFEGTGSVSRGSSILADGGIRLYQGF